MSDDFSPSNEELWEAGFEGGRHVVVAQWGPLVRCYPRPKGFVKRFYHQVHELAIHDWNLTVEPTKMGSFCTVKVEVNIRFQPTYRYAQDHLEFLPELSRQIKASHQSLLMDVIEEELKSLERDVGWLEAGCAQIEKAIERTVNELLAIRNLQCRTRCLIDPILHEVAALDSQALSPWSRHQAVYQELLERQRQARLRLERAQIEESLSDQQIALEREMAALELKRQEHAMRKTRMGQEIESLKAELKAQEALENEQRSSESRERQEQIRHTAHLRQLESEAELSEKQRRAQSMVDMEGHITREIELLAMERQRLLLEEEVREIKVSKAKGWVINAKKRFALGEERRSLQSQGPEEPEEPSGS